LTALGDPFASTGRDPARSYEPLDEADLERLGRVADAELGSFFGRNAHLVGWRERVRIIALCQGGAEHYLRGRRGVWDLDVIVCFADDPTLPRLRRRMVDSSDRGHSRRIGRIACSAMSALLCQSLNVA
jgi:hypothetical protein